MKDGVKVEKVKVEQNKGWCHHQPTVTGILIIDMQSRFSLYNIDINFDRRYKLTRVLILTLFCF